MEGERTGREGVAREMDRAPFALRPPLATSRFHLLSINAECIEAILAGDVATLRGLTGANVSSAWEPPPLVDQDALGYVLNRLRGCADEEPWWMRFIVTRDGREIVGTVGLKGRPDDSGTVEVGYAVYPDRQNAGAATEAAAALVAWALEQPGVNRVTATIPPWNAPSIRVAEKLGMRQVGVEPNDEVGEVLVYAVERKGNE